MYTTNGTEGYSIPPAETGMLAGDLYHINHTCVRKYVSSLMLKKTKSNFINNRPNICQLSVVSTLPFV